MSNIRRLLDQIEKYRLPSLPSGNSNNAEASATSDMFAGVGSSSATKDNEFGFLGGDPTSSVSAPASKVNDPFGSSDPFSMGSSVDKKDIFNGIN